MLPKFLIADNSQDTPGKLFVVHTEQPRFILEGDDDDFYENQEVYWIDEPAGQDQIDELIGHAEDFLESELANQEDLYDNMED